MARNRTDSLREERLETEAKLCYAIPAQTK